MKQRTRVNITVHQLSDIVKLALMSKYFRIGKQTIQQIRGCLIGNPIAPVLCNIAILNPEIRFRAKQLACHKAFCPVRYVDNLLCITDDPQYTGFASNFYTDPIELEACDPIGEYLGVKINIHEGKRLTFMYIVKKDTFLYQHAASAGSLTRRLSSLFSRAHMAITLSSPNDNKIACLKELFHHYEQLGYMNLQEYYKKYMKRFTVI
jgi:hypothetical protein